MMIELGKKYQTEDGEVRREAWAVIDVGPAGGYIHGINSLFFPSQEDADKFALLKDQRIAHVTWAS